MGPRFDACWVPLKLLRPSTGNRLLSDKVVANVRISGFTPPHVQLNGVYAISDVPRVKSQLLPTVPTYVNKGNSSLWLLYFIFSDSWTITSLPEEKLKILATAGKQPGKILPQAISGTNWYLMDTREPNRVCIEVFTDDMETKVSGLQLCSLLALLCSVMFYSELPCFCSILFYSTLACSEFLYSFHHMAALKFS